MAEQRRREDTLARQRFASFHHSLPSSSRDRLGAPNNSNFNNTNNNNAPSSFQNHAPSSFQNRASSFQNHAASYQQHPRSVSLDGPQELLSSSEWHYGAVTAAAKAKPGSREWWEKRKQDRCAAQDPEAEAEAEEARRLDRFSSDSTSSYEDEGELPAANPEVTNASRNKGKSRQGRRRVVQMDGTGRETLPVSKLGKKQAASKSRSKPFETSNGMPHEPSALKPAVPANYGPGDERPQGVASVEAARANNVTAVTAVTATTNPATAVTATATAEAAALSLGLRTKDESMASPVPLSSLPALAPVRTTSSEKGSSSSEKGSFSSETKGHEVEDERTSFDSSETSFEGPLPGMSVTMPSCPEDRMREDEVIDP